MTPTDQTIGISIDAELCAASAMCPRIAPMIFELPDDADTARVRQPTLSDPALTKLAEQAAAECPTGAILISSQG
jgi:ferredoxin